MLSINYVTIAPLKLTDVAKVLEAVESDVGLDVV